MGSTVILNQCTIITSNKMRINTNKYPLGMPSYVIDCRRVPARPPTVTSVEIDDGPLVAKQLTELADVHAAVAHAAASMRALGVWLLAPNPSPETVTIELSVLAALSTPT